MLIRKLLKSLFKISIAMLLLLSSIFVSMSAVKADNTTPKELTEVINGVELLDASDTKQKTTETGEYLIRTGQAYKLRVTFDLKKYNENLNNGDYFTFDIPAPMTVYNDKQQLVDPTTKVNIGEAVVTANGSDKGGKITVTLKNLDKYLAATGGDKVKDVSGNFSGSFRFIKDQTSTLISFNSNAMKQEIRQIYTSKTISGPKVGVENYAKVGGQAERNEWSSPKLAAIGSVSKGDAVSNWRVRVNTEKQDFGQNIVLHDSIPNDDVAYTPAQYIPESLKVYKADITSGTSGIPDVAELMVEGKDYTVSWNENYTSFDITIKDGTTSYFITYSTTTPNDGTKVANVVALSQADGKKLSQNTSRPNAFSMKAEATSLISGTIVASTAYQIKINKTDAFTLSPVSGAVYTVTAVDDPTETTEATTNEKGIALTKTYDQKWEGKLFKIKEKTAPAGYTLDEKEYTLKLGAAGSVINLKDNPIPAKVNIKAKKVVSGREGGLPKADEFTFNLYSVGNLNTPIATAKTKADGTITFENIEVKGTGVYNYVIKEDTTNAVAGVTFDEAAKEITVKAEFQGSALKASVTSDEPIFTNTYTAKPTKASITATKALNGSTLKDDQFEFELKEGAKVVGTAKNKADGTVTFEDITYTEAGVHTYTLTEKEGTEGGVTYDKTSHEVKVEVTDNGQGKLVAAVTGNNPAFTNTYKAAETKATITATKVLNGSTLKDDQFEFELKEGAKVVGTAKNKADGTITFEDITYTEAGVHTYTLTEKEGTEGGVTYDKTPREVKVEVTDNGQGKLVAAVTGNNPTFTNTYKAAETKATITAKKVLEGKALEADKYEFELKEGTKVVGTAKNKADGTVTFEDITYTEVGEHEYTVTEKAGNEAGVTYDSKSYTVKVKVTDNGQGQLEAAVTDNNPTFTNTYKAAVTKATIKAKKVLEGKDLKENQFEFELKEGTEAVGTAKNKADGSIAFDVEYTKAGEYEYTVTEKAGNEAGVTYDSKSYTVKVKVTDNGQGQLEAKVTGDGDNVIFTNKYNKPATETPDGSNDPEPKKTLPNTGDTDSLVLPGLLGFALMAVSAFLYRAKNNN